MTMTNEEICREYRTAKAPLKQIQILAELNQCDKNSSIEVAKRLFPGIDLRRTERSRKDDDGLAEALLMAEYARRTL